MRVTFARQPGWDLLPRILYSPAWGGGRPGLYRSPRYVVLSWLRFEVVFRSTQGGWG